MADARRPIAVGESGPGIEAPIGAALAPLRQRYDQWMSSTAELADPDAVLADREEPANEIRAMQLVVRMERAQPPSWTLALSAAATGAALLCLDSRSEPGGEWFDAVSAYCNGHIRKVTRRARAGQWAASAELPGLTIEQVGVDARPAAGDEPARSTVVGAQVRVLVPGLVSDLDPRISRLQVGGTDAPVDAASVPDLERASALHVWLPPEPQMTLGKTMAQTGHAGMIAAALLAEDDPAEARQWRDLCCPTVVHGRTERWAELSAALLDAAAGWRDERLLAVRDAGFTEIAPGTVTVIARAPHRR